MNWFEQQLDTRRRYDNDALRDAYGNAVNAVVGDSFSFDEAEDAISHIIRYYGLPPVRLPEDITDESEKLGAACRLTGLMQRPVVLDGEWYLDAFGAFLCRTSDGEYVAVIPDKFGVYTFYNNKTHKRVTVNKRTAAMLDKNAICFYKPLPNRVLTVADVIKFAVSSWSVADYALTLIMLAITTLVGILTPRLSHFLYSEVIESASVSLLVSTMIFIVAVQISSLLFNSMKAVFSSRTNVKMSAALRSAAMMRVMSLPMSFFRTYSSGEIISRMDQLNNVSTGIISMLFSTGLSSVFSLAYITQIFNYSPSLVLPSLAVILTNVIFSVYTTARQMKISRRQLELSAKNGNIGIETVSGIQKIKISGAENRAFARYTTQFSELTRMRYNPPLFNKYNSVISLAIMLVGQLLIYFVTVKSSVDVAGYYAFQTSYGMISVAITGLVGIALRVADLRPSIEMLKPILETVPENAEKAQQVTRLGGGIEFNNVYFRYSDNAPYVIEDFSLKISSGQYVAIVGKTGCGKSTLIKLLLGFEKAQKGGIYYDGKDINTLEKRSLRQKIGVVMQDDKLFAGDIYSNIVMCSPTLPLASAWDAAEIAGIADDIRAMPMGMRTIISEGSGGISGGQRQRIAIARAIAPKPKILIFDEATSALDNVTQKQVSDALDSLKCTRIVIAHRLSTIKHCDRILVMDKGRIIEDGKYDDLVSKNGYFAELVDRQRLDK